MTKARLAKLVALFGGKVEEERSGRYLDIRVDAPRGKVWSSDGIHQIVGGCFLGDKTWYDDARDEVAARVSCGVEECAEAGRGCEICDEEA